MRRQGDLKSLRVSHCLAIALILLMVSFDRTVSIRMLAKERHDTTRLPRKSWSPYRTRSSTIWRIHLGVAKKVSKPFIFSLKWLA